MAMYTKRVWSARPTKVHGEWSKPEVVDAAECMRVLAMTKLFPEKEMERLNAGKVVNCGIITFRGHLGVETCECLAHKLD